MTRWLDYFSIFGHLQREKVDQNIDIFAKVGSKFCQSLNNPLTIWQIFINFCQSGEMSPNLVTLILSQVQPYILCRLVLAQTHWSLKMPMNKNNSWCFKAKQLFVEECDSTIKLKTLEIKVIRSKLSQYFSTFDTHGGRDTFTRGKNITDEVWWKNRDWEARAKLTKMEEDKK